ncbi:response regulator transcription factor [Eubacteriales bacterium OttesenSCG-928-M02]|nr:response regulator transcription factor [Eubacteriales bacterium OttesenSCG-928-M02]
MPIRILIVDDEPLILKGLRFSLEQDGYQVDEALDGETALHLAQQNQYDIILLDVMLPKMSGTEVLRSIRDDLDVPIIMLTAKGDDMDKILGLEYGADDYMVKPFNILEVKARIRSVLRRSGQRQDVETSRIQIRDLEIDLISRSVSRGGKDIALTSKEFDLLHILMENPGRVFDRQELMELLNAKDRTGDINGRHDLRTVDVYIRRLREKVEWNPASPEYIMTRWGVGYYFAGK